MTHQRIAPSIGRLLSDGVFVPIALIYAIAAAAFGCSGSGSVSINSGTANPNRALGTYRIPRAFGESESRVFFGYWLTGDNDIEQANATAFQSAVATIGNTATVTIVPNSILYEETAVELYSGRLVTVSISGTWSYENLTRMRVNWGSSFVTASTFPADPPFDVAVVGTLINGPQPGDFVFANNVNWTQLTSVAPGPLDGVFVRD